MNPHLPRPRLWLGIVLCLLTTPLASPAQNTAQLPAQWTMKQWSGADSWTWTMTQSAPGRWRGAVRHDRTGQQGVEDFALTGVQGSQITLSRAGVGAYSGTIAPDGKSITGTCNFIGGGWSAAFPTSLFAVATLPTTPPADKSPLPANFTMKQSSGADSWTWTMTQRSPTSWSATVRHDSSGQQGADTFTLTRLEGNRLTLHRAGAGNYLGTIASDGKSITGTCDFLGGGWSISLTGSTSTPPPPPQSAPQRDLGATLVVVYPSVCTAIWTRTAPSTYDAVTICQGPGNSSFRETLTVESFDGRAAVILRPNYGRYRATLDGKVLRGTCDWRGCEGNYRWTGYSDWNWNDSPPLR
jgi:hypothetical protein